MQVEGYVDGDEFALEGVMDHGRLHVLAIFDKPDPLDRPVLRGDRVSHAHARAPSAQCSWASSPP